MLHTLLQVLFVSTFSLLNTEAPDCFPIFSSSADYETFRQCGCETPSDNGVKLKGFVALNKLNYQEQEYAVKEVWGFKKGDTVYRAHEGKLYRIVDSGLVVYEM